MTLSGDRVTLLVDNYKKYLLTNKHPDTVRGCMTDVRHYLGWCADHGVELGPVDDESTYSGIANICLTIVIAMCQQLLKNWRSSSLLLLSWLQLLALVENLLVKIICLA